MDDDSEQEEAGGACLRDPVLHACIPYALFIVDVALSAVMCMPKGREGWNYLW